MKGFTFHVSEPCCMDCGNPVRAHESGKHQPIAVPGLVNQVLARLPNPSPQLRQHLSKLGRNDLEHMLVGLPVPRADGTFSVHARADDEDVRAMVGGISSFRINERFASADGNPRVIPTCTGRYQPGPTLGNARFHAMSAAELAEFGGPPSSRLTPSS
jgi:hypothetical protein